MTSNLSFGESIRTLLPLVSTREKRRFVFLLALCLIMAVVELGITGLVALLAATFSAPDSVLQLRPIAFLREVTGGLFVDTRLLAFAILSAILVAIIVKNFLVLVQQAQVVAFSGAMSRATKTRILRYYFRAPLLWLRHMGSVKLLFVLSAVGNVGSLLNHCLILTANVLMIFVVFSGLVATSPLPALTFLCLLLFSAASIMHVVRTKVDSNGRRVFETRQCVYNIEQVAIHGIRDIRLNTREQAFDAAYASDLAEEMAAEKRYQVFLRLPSAALEAAGFATLCVVLLMLIYVLDKSMAYISGVMGFMAATAWRVLPAGNRVMEGVANIRGLLPFVGIVAEMIRKDSVGESQIGLSSFAAEAPVLPFVRGITLTDVSFRYPEATRDALTRISFSIPKRSMVGIVGCSGAGKSTLVDILTGVITPLSGNVRIDDTVLDASNKVSWLRKVGYVPQAPYLLDATLAENVAFSRWGEDIDRERVLRCCQMAALDFLDNLQDGMDTVLGERGARLSGGQAQRVAIARALYGQPELIVLDEATSALDDKNEQAIYNTVLQLKNHLTVIIIAHRLRTVQDCDLILWLEDGKIAMVGASSEVLPCYRNAMETAIVQQEYVPISH